MLSTALFAAPCPDGDLNNDCIVDYKDMRILADQWLDPSCSCNDPNRADLNLQNGTEFADYSIMADNFDLEGSFNMNIVYPSDAGVGNVKTQYGAYGDGIHDDTSAIQNALNNNVNGIVYLPNGTYLVSDRLEWPSNAITSQLILRGQSTNGTIIKLRNTCSGFQNPGSPKSVVWTQIVGSADNFRNYVRNLTIDTGRGNPGAIGLQMMSNNNGGVFDVKIKSGDGQGVIGLDFAYASLNGPLLAKNIQIEGFDIGIRTDGGQNSQVLEHIKLIKQNTYGIYNTGQVLSIRKVSSFNSVPAFRNFGGGSVATFLDCDLAGFAAASTQPAIINTGTIFARNLRTSCYQYAIESDGNDFTGPHYEEFCSGGIYTLFDTEKKSLDLPIKETPEVPWDNDFSNWANVATASGSNYQQKIQNAIDSGKSTLYFPIGYNYSNVGGPIYIRGNVRRFVGLGEQIKFASSSQPAFILVEDSNCPPVVVVDQLQLGGSYTPGIVIGEGRSLVLRASRFAGRTYTGPGELFFEDVIGGIYGQFVFNGDINVWARHLGCEVRENRTHVINDASHLWVLGYKTEQGGVLVETKNHGYTEILGHFSYPAGGGDKLIVYDVNESYLSVTMRENVAGYQTLVRQTQLGHHRYLTRTDIPESFPLTAVIPHFVGRAPEPNENGQINMTKEQYSPDDTIVVYMMDRHLKGNVTACLQLTTATGDTETITLNEYPSGSGIFKGTMLTEQTTVAAGDGTLQIWHNDTITLTYNDANDGTGNPIVKNDTATVLGTQIVLYEEDFSSDIPVNWTVIDGFEDTITWDTLNSWGYWKAGDKFAIVDYFLKEFDMNEQLITQSYDCSGHPIIELQFDHEFSHVSNEIGTVAIRIDQGPWQNLITYDQPGIWTESGTVRVDISTYALGQNDVQFRWHYFDADYEHFWGIDNVKVVTYDLP